MKTNKFMSKTKVCFKSVTFLGATAFIGILASSIAIAQTDNQFRDTTTQTTPTIERGETDLPVIPKSTTKSDNNTVIADRLNQVVIYQSPHLYQSCTTTGTSTVELVGKFPYGMNILVEDSLMTDFLGQALKVSDLARINAAVRESWNTLDDLVNMSYVPAGQRVSSGTLCIVMEPLVVGKQLINDTQSFDKKKIAAEMSIQPGDELRLKKIYDDVAWLNRNPFRDATMNFAPGSAQSETDLSLTLRDQKPWQVSASFDNYGDKETGRFRTIGNAIHGNLWGKEHVVAVNVIKTDDWNDYLGLGGYYLLPMVWNKDMRHEIIFRASFADSSDDYSNDNFTFDNRQINAGVDYLVPMGHWLLDRMVFRNELSFAWDYKSSKDDIFFGSTSSFDNRYDISQFTAGLSTDVTDNSGRSNITASITASPGGMTDYNNTTNISKSRSGADDSYAYAYVNLERSQDLPKETFKGATLFGRLAGQYTNSRLPGTETFSAGGVGTIRGYENSVLNGDIGAGLTIELRSPYFSDQLVNKDYMRLALFYENAMAKNIDALVTETNGWQTAHAVGVGLRYGVEENLNAGIDLAFPLTETDGEDDQQILRISVGLSY